MATRRITRTSTNVGLSRNQPPAKIPVMTRIPPIKRTRSTTDVNCGPEQKKRSVFGDITNKKETKKTVNGKTGIPVKPNNAKITRSKSKIPTVCPSDPVKEEPLLINLTEALDLTEKTQPVDLTKKTQPLQSSAKTQAVDLTEKTQLVESTEKTQPSIKESTESEQETSEEVIDFDSFDKEHADQPFWEAEYAKDIFIYYKKREAQFEVPDYMSRVQTDITPEMRTILMDWLVEVQTNFELHHETLYLAVKLVDMYLSKIRIKRTYLQIVGTAALFIACKFDERILPQCEDFLYVCDSAYTMEKLFEMERKMLVTVNFELGIPLSYRFLRRYCKVANIGIKTMTLGRYILELTLLEYQFCYESESLKAAGCVWLALKMENMKWNAMLTHHSGYTNEEAKAMAKKLNQMLWTPNYKPVNEIYSKYSHEVFLSVAKIPKLQMDQLEE